MENESKNILIDKARLWCETNVYDWQTINVEKQEWYLKKVARLLLDDPEVLKTMFASQLN